MKKTIAVIVGPTAVGKTKLSIEAAKRFNGEVISGDSMQIYRGMDIGTAKVTESEMQGIPHHLIDVKEPCDPYTAADFKREVTRSIDAILEKGKLPIIAGGSGLYIQAVLHDYEFAEQKRDEQLTERLKAELDEHGSGYLYERLKTFDPEQAEKIHPNNARRLIRALEVYESTGKKMSELQKQEQALSAKYNAIMIGLEMERALLYERINERVDKMIENGLIDEVQTLVSKGYEGCQSMRAIGYKEIIPYLKGEQPLEEAVAQLKQNSRRYAKRQYTWFRNKMDVHWYAIHPETIYKNFSQILDDLAGFLGNV